MAGTLRGKHFKLALQSCAAAAQQLGHGGASAK
jgi:hypothetical protein